MIIETVRGRSSLCLLASAVALACVAGCVPILRRETAIARCARIADPVMVKIVPPVYTAEAIAAGISGYASLECTFLTDGRLSDCRLQQRIPLMERAILEATQKWRCTPALLDGEPIEAVRIVWLKLVPPAPSAAPPTELSPAADPSADANTKANANTGVDSAAVKEGMTHAPEPPPRGTIVGFREGMVRPSFVSGPQPVYTEKARDACIQGTLLAKCVITTEGRLIKCRIIKSLPYLDQAVLDALAQQRYTPFRFKGVPSALEFVIPFKFAIIPGPPSKASHPRSSL